jgi:3-hydroxyacyl-[acyl-carrier-protein] dehydratase
MAETYRTIEDLLPHRPPFVFVDRLTYCSKEEIHGEYTFTGEEQFFTGHFPGYPVVPGVLLIEMMAQCGGAGLKQVGLIPENGLFFLATIDKAKFRREIKPGDRAVIEIRNLRASRSMLKQAGTVKVDGQVCTEAQWMCIVGLSEE